MLPSRKTIYIQVINSKHLFKNKVRYLLLKFSQVSIGILLITALFFSITNRTLLYPLLIFLGLVLLAINTIINTKKLSIPKLWFSLTTLGVYFLASAIISKLPINDILTFEFFRRDGNFFVSFFPLFLLPLIAKARIKKTVIWNKAIQGTLWTIAVFTNLLTLSYIIHHPIGLVDIYGIYFYLFQSHNGAGTFYVVMFFISFLMLLNPFFKKSRIGNLLSTISFLIALIITKSRGSIVGAAFALIILMINKIRPFNRYRKLLTFIFLLLVILINAIFLNIGYKGWLDLGKPIQNYSSVKSLPTFLNRLSFEEYERFGNIADRLFYLWPRAFHYFLLSPFVGIGFTRYNDSPPYLEGIPHILMLNTTQINIIFSSAHAHHTFLHVMAETGIIGLFLLIIFIKDLLKFISKIRHFLAPGIYYAIWAIIGASFTEHRLFTPSGLLVINLLIVIAYITQKSTKQKGSVRTA